MQTFYQLSGGGGGGGGGEVNKCVPKQYSLYYRPSSFSSLKIAFRYYSMTDVTSQSGELLVFGQ